MCQARTSIQHEKKKKNKTPIGSERQSLAPGVSKLKQDNWLLFNHASRGRLCWYCSECVLGRYLRRHLCWSPQFRDQSLCILWMAAADGAPIGPLTLLWFSLTVNIFSFFRGHLIFTLKIGFRKKNIWIFEWKKDFPKIFTVKKKSQEDKRLQIWVGYLDWGAFQKIQKKINANLSQVSFQICIRNP